MKEKEVHNASQLPIHKIPGATSEAPLVVDLPDGQKIVIGNLPAGTVIEIATWQGTGRPDSRTTRLMLGVAGASVIQDDKNPNDTPESSKNVGRKKKWLNRLKNSRLPRIPKPKIPVISKVEASTDSKVTKSRRISRRERDQIEPENSIEISEWLKSIRAAAILDSTKQPVSKAKKGPQLARTTAKKATARKSSTRKPVR